MLYNLLYPLAGDIPFFNLFRYLTFRSGGAIITALVISFVIGPRLIRWLRTNQHGGQPIRSDGPESHLLTKKGTPTMGGLMMLFAVTVSTLLWADITNHYCPEQDRPYVIPMSHLSFRVDNPTNARITATIQKRMTTVGSFQPSFSKW